MLTKIANMIALAAKGITLSNYYGITHPSEPNYCAIYGGDNFGMDNDAFNQIPANVSNIWVRNETSFKSPEQLLMSILGSLG